MRLNLRNEVHRYLNHDEQSRTAQNKRDRQFRNQNLRQNAQRSQIKRAEHRQAGNHIIQIFGRIFARTDTGNKAAMLLKVVRGFFRIDHNGGIEESEKDD